MCAGADCIDDVDVLRSGAMTTLCDAVYAPSTTGTLLREFTFGHARQLESVLAGHLEQHHRVATRESAWDHFGKTRAKPRDVV